MAGDRFGALKFLCRSVDRKHLMRFQSETSIFNFIQRTLYGTLGPVHTNPFSKRFASTLIVFESFSPVHTTTLIKKEATW